MKRHWILATIFIEFLYIQVSMGGSLPTFDELKDQLPFELTANMDDKYFFFIVPIQKDNTPNVILQMAQVQDSANESEASLGATIIDIRSNSVETILPSENKTLADVFTQPDVATGDESFNFQEPVIIPMDFYFTYNRDSASVDLPECTIDSRTWKENAITNIANKLKINGVENWDHNELTVRIRLRKDVLGVISVTDITTAEKLTKYVTTIQNTKSYADIRYSNYLQNVTELTADHLAIIAEGRDTYSFLKKSLTKADAASYSSGIVDDPVGTVAFEQTRIQELKTGVDASVLKFDEAYDIVKNLQDVEEINVE